MEQNNHLNEKPFKAYTEDDFLDALTGRFPDGMTLSVKDLEAEHLYNYFRINTFDGDDAMVMHVGKNMTDVYPVSRLKAEVRIKPEEYKHITAGYDGVVDIDYYDMLQQKSVDKDDYVSTFVMNEYPDLQQAPVTVAKVAVAKNLWVEGLHFHDAMAVVIKKPALEDYELKSLLQLKAIYTRGSKFFDEGWQMTADVAKNISTPEEWRRNFDKTAVHYQQTTGHTFTEDEIKQVYDASVKSQAKTALQEAGVLRVTPKTYMVYIRPDKADTPDRHDRWIWQHPENSEVADEINKARLHHKLEELADKFNANYLEESLADKAAYAVHPEGADYLMINVNTTKPLRHFVAQNRIQTLPDFEKSFEVKYENIYKHMADVPENILNEMDDKVRKVHESDERYSQLMYHVNNGGAYFYQRNALGYVHISTGRTMLVNGEPLSKKNMEKLHQLAADGNIIGHRGTEHRTLFCPPRQPQQRLMMDNSVGTVHHMDVQYDINRKEYLTTGYRVVDPSHYTDISERIGNVSVYGQKDRLFMRAVIDGQQQSGRLLTHAQKARLRFYTAGLDAPESLKYLKLVAGEVYKAEIEQSVQRSQEEDQSKSFKR